MKKFDENNGLVFNIQKFSIHDGEGIRTLVFMKGCPLNCKWCCNPESQLFTEDILYVRTKCIRCGSCVSACPQNGIDKERYFIDRELCMKCGSCSNVCYANAKKKVGFWITKSEILEELEKDSIVFRNSNGGITIGGGEPICQPEFVASLLRDARQLNFRTAMESCGYGEWDKIKGIYPHLDELFMDIKCMDPKKHKELTGVSNELILENAKRINQLGLNMKITFRVPLIPGYNDTKNNIENTVRFINSLKTNAQLEILEYHRLGEDKFKWMDREYELKDIQCINKKNKIEIENFAESLGCNIIRQQ